MLSAEGLGCLREDAYEDDDDDKDCSDLSLLHNGEGLSLAGIVFRAL